MLKNIRLSIKNQRGNAMIEIVPILAIFILLVNFALGFFGLIHSGILNSIAARNYAFETFRNRSDLHYLRDIVGTDVDFTYSRAELRYHAIRGESSKSTTDFEATRRPIRFSEIRGVASELGTNEHGVKVKGIVEGQRASEKGIDEGVSPAWIRTAYGICLNANCGG
jgi:hypothetical protein